MKQSRLTQESKRVHTICDPYTQKVNGGWCVYAPEQKKCNMLT